MNTSNLSDSSKHPARLPIVVRAGDLQALADRLETYAAGDPIAVQDLIVAARLARHAAVVWVGGFAAVSLK